MEEGSSPIPNSESRISLLIYLFGSGMTIIVIGMGGMLWSTRRELRALRKALGKKVA